MVSFTWPKLTMGVCYYPEHWKPSLWHEDLKRMKQTGISVVRIGEFAWNKFEPREGEFTYDLFDDFLDLCLEEGMQVIFGTPTATPPAWLTEKYPECLNARRDGTLLRHGSRRHYNYNSPRYRELSGRIVEMIAAHIGRHPAIIGWQIDNELNCEADEFYSEADSAAFRVFLQEKYGTLDALNQAWGAVFWNQDYTDWAQIHVPRATIRDNTNPHQALDYRRFISWSTRSFCKMQSDILRRYVPKGVFITTNGMFRNVDNHKMTAESLDTYTYDSYPNFAFELPRNYDPTALNDRKWSLNLAEVRSICPHFGIMEQQSGACGWAHNIASPSPRPGQAALWSMQSLAHGADFISYFRWRTCTVGTEIYWHGILNYDNRDTRTLREIAAFHRDMEKLQPLSGADHVAAFALVKDYDNLWDAAADTWHKHLDSWSLTFVPETAQRTNTPHDVVYLRDDTPLSDLERYPLLIYPHALILTPARAALLTRYVEQGGTLILGCRTGQKDINGHCVMQPMPGLLADLAGVQVQDFTFCSSAEDPITADFGGRRIPMPLFNEVLHPLPGAKVLARYENGYYAGEPALVENRLGKGRALYLGSVFTVENLTAILHSLGMLTPWADTVTVPEKVELVVREKAGRRWLILLNYGSTAQTVTLRRPMTSLLSGEQRQGDLTLPAFGYEVFEM